MDKSHPAFNYFLNAVCEKYVQPFYLIGLRVTHQNVFRDIWKVFPFVFLKHVYHSSDNVSKKKKGVESNKGTHNTSRTALIESISGGSYEDSN